jgi:hypothetical protein
LSPDEILLQWCGYKVQNGIAVHDIKTVPQWACANMIHMANSWPQYADSKYWAQAIYYATWVFNKPSNMESGTSPDELWSGVRRNDSALQRAHVLVAQSMSLMQPFKIREEVVAKQLLMVDPS